MEIKTLQCLNVSNLGDAVRLALQINDERKQYDVRFASLASGVTGFDFPAEVRRILRQHGTAARELTRLCSQVVDGEKPFFPQTLILDETQMQATQTDPVTQAA